MIIKSALILNIRDFVQPWLWNINPETNYSHCRTKPRQVAKTSLYIRTKLFMIRLLLVLSTCRHDPFSYRCLKHLPVSSNRTVSLALAQNSFIAVIGTPAEIYVFGTTMSYTVITHYIIAIISAEIYIPLFYRLKLTSTYEVRAFLPTHFLLLVEYFKITDFWQRLSWKLLLGINCYKKQW